MSRKDIKELIGNITNNLRDTQDIIGKSSSDMKEMVEDKYVSTITMLLDGTESTQGSRFGVLNNTW